jgi:putative CocE/NonD family hydrolase
MPPGPKDQRALESRKDVLVYSSSPLQADLTIIGHVDVHLFTSTSARDTDWTAKLVDVAPEDPALNLVDGILRARFYQSFEDPELLEPGKSHEFVIDLGNTAVVIPQGHRVRLEISSSNFPRYSRNTNTGAVPEKDKETVVAHQTVYHDRSRKSYVNLPIAANLPNPATQ